MYVLPSSIINNDDELYMVLNATRTFYHSFSILIIVLYSIKLLCIDFSYYMH